MNDLNELLKRHVDDLDLSVRSAMILSHLGAETLGELTRLSEEEILSDSFGNEVALYEIKEALSGLGLSLNRT